jgi:hypothetical protein
MKLAALRAELGNEQRGRAPAVAVEIVGWAVAL